MLKLRKDHQTIGGGRKGASVTPIGNRRAQRLAAEALERRTLLSDVAVFGDNQTDNVLAAAGHNVTLVTDAQLATPGFLDGFDAFFFTRPGGAFNATLSAGAAAQVRVFTKRAVLLNGDFTDALTSDQEIRDLFVSSVRWAAEHGGGYIGELEGATAGLSANGDGQPALNFIAGAAGTSQFTGNSSTITATAAGAGHPVLDGVALPHTNDDIEFAAPVSGALDPDVLARYANGNAAILAAEMTRVAVLGNNATDDELNEEPGLIASLVTDAQVGTPGFLDGFDAFIFTRPGGAFNATLSAGAAAQARAFTRRAVLLNGDFADSVAADQEIHDLFVSSVRWAAEHGGGYIGELEGATAGLSANGDGQPALNFIAGSASASQFTGNSSTITATAAGAGHPVLDGVALPHTADDIEFAAAVSGAPTPQVLARYANDNPAILVGEVRHVAVLGNNATDDELNEEPGIVASLVSDAQVATPGFLDGFDAFFFTRPGGAFNATLSAGAAAQVRVFTKRAVLLNGDFTDALTSDQEIRDLFVSSVRWAAEHGGGYIGELEGATAGLSANGDGQPALNFIAGAAGTSQFTGNSSTITATAAGAGHPVLDGVALPHTNDDIEFAAPVSGALDPDVLARYANGNAAILAAEMTRVAVLGNNATDDELNEEPGLIASLVTDAQVGTPGFLDGFDAFIFTRPGGAFNATLSAGAAAQARAFTRRAVLLNGDFADSVAADQEIHDLFVSSVRWAAEHGGGYIGELEGATAGLSANGDGQPALNFIAGSASASQFTGNSSTITATAAGAGHPVLDGVALPHTADDIEFAAAVSGAPTPNILARYANGNPAVLASDFDQPVVTISDVAVTEGNSGQTTAGFTISLSGPSEDPISITVSTVAGGSATPGADYVEKTQVITFASGETSHTFTVDVVGDTIDEFNQTFHVALSNPSNVRIAETGMATGTIEDDDAAPTVSINNVSVNEGNNGTSTAGFTVSLSTFSEKPITLEYGTADDTATSPSDYLSANDTISFAPGETSKPVNVTINGDTTVESDERFLVSLTNATDATLGTTQGIGTIVNDDVVTDNTPPVVTGFTINAGLTGGVERSMVNNIRVAFSEPVNGSLLDQNAFVLRRGGAVVPNLTINIEIAPDRMSAKLTFGGSAVVGGSLPDGHYALTVPKSRVHDDAGNVALADGSLAFDRRFGDINGNGVTDNSDFIIMRAANGKRSTDAGYLWYLDYDNDGLIGSTDYSQFGSRLNIRY